MWAFFKLQNYFSEHPSLLARIQVGGKINGVNYVSRKWVILYMLFKNEFNFNCVWKSDTELKELGSVEYQLPYGQGPLLRVVEVGQMGTALPLLLSFVVFSY